MSSTPNPRPLSVIFDTIRKTFIAKSGVNDAAVGSSNRDFLEAASLSDFRSQSDIMAALNSTDIDRAEGVDLDNIGNAEDVPRPQSKTSSGTVTLGTTQFVKIATKIYAGTAAPPIGSTTINISDGSLFPQTGQVYLGRGSNNVEGPISYSSVTAIGNFYQLLLVTPTTKNHNLNETVVLAQGGNRPVNVGSIVQTQANTTAPAVTFRTLVSVVVPDGEDTLSGVPVVCTILGSIGNVPFNAIQVFANPPYPGATVTNPVGYINGQDVASDQAYRLLIKNAAQTASLGTDLANQSAAVGVTSTDDDQTVTSAEILTPANRNEPSIMYVDNGNAYEPIFSGQGYEVVVANANGGEIYLQLQNEDITKALAVSSFATPFTLTGGVVLAVEVGGVRSEHTFQDSDFATQNAANTFEIVNSINGDTSLLFSATAADNGQNVLIFAKAYVHEDIKVVPPANPLATDANSFLGFDPNLIYTLRLYKNDVLLIKDGITPSITTSLQSAWLTMTSGETLTIKADQSQYITYTFVDADFIPFGYPTLSQVNSLAAWANVFNNKVAGITATVNGGSLVFTSNLGANNNAAININSVGSSLAAKMFGFSSGILVSTGKTSDYALNRATAQLELTAPLVPGDVVTAGSINTRAFVESTSIATGTVSMLAQTSLIPGPYVWVTLDSPAIFVSSFANAATTITITNPSANIWRFTSSATNAFLQGAVGDWVVVADDALFGFNNNFMGAWRVTAIGAQFFEFEMTQSLGSTGIVSLVTSNKINFVNTLGSMQQLPLLSGTNTLTAIATAVNAFFQGGFASAVGGKILSLTSNTYATTGMMTLAAFTNNAAVLGFKYGAQDESVVTHTAFAQAQTGELTFPSFIFDTVATGDANIPPQNIVTTTNLPVAGVNPDQFLSFLDTYAHDSSNKRIYTQIAALNGTAVQLRPNSKMRDIVSGDRYFPAYPYNFTAKDNLVVILDNDPVNKALNIVMSRLGTVSNVSAPTTTTFRAYDTAAGPTANYANQFGNNYNFADFKIHFAAHQVLVPAGVNNAMLISAALLGPTGNSINFGIDYPSAPNSPLTFSAADTLYTNLKVYLASGPQRLGGSWNSSTQFDVTNTVGNTYRYTYNGIGSSPLFVTNASIAIGDIVNITPSNFESDNVGVYKITAISDTYFEIMNPFGFAQNNIQLTGSANLVFYPLNASANTTALISTFINANLTNWVTSSLLQAGGTITTSTYDDNVGSSEFVQLADGENWIASSNIGTTISPQNQFTLKVPLTVTTAPFTLVGRQFYLIPTTTAQIVSFLNVFAVTGLSSLGNIVASSDASRPEIYSDLFGSSGSVLVSGGSANAATGLVTVSGSSVLQDEILSMSVTGSTVTVTTANRHDLSVGDVVTIADVNSTLFDGGYFTVTATTARTFSYVDAIVLPTIVSTTRTSNVVTVVTSVAHNLAVGDVVTIAGTSTYASFVGVIPGTSTSVTLTANTLGLVGNSIALVFTGSNSIATAITTWNVANPSNQVTLTTGDGTQIPTAQTLTLSGGMTYDGTFSVLTIPTTTSFTYAQAGANSTSTGGAITTIESFEGSVSTPFTSIDIGAPDIAGFQAGEWLYIANTYTQAKITGLQPNTDLSITGLNTLSIVSGPGVFQTLRSTSADSSTQMKVEQQAQFICFSWTGAGTNPALVAGGVQEGDWVKVGGNFNIVNQGIFKIVKVFGNSFYIQAPTDIEEEITMSGNTDLVFYSYDSVMPGDQLIIEAPVLGTLNQGTYTVASSTANSITITTAFNSNIAYAVSVGVIPGTSTSVTLTANNVGGIGNSIALAFTGSNTIAAAIITWNTANPSNQVTLTSGNGAQIPTIQTATLGGGGGVPLLLAYTQIVVQEAVPYTVYKYLLNLSQDPLNVNSYTMILKGDILASKISVAAGATVTAQSKLNFPTIVQFGEDSYKYYGGLIHAVGQTLRGEPTDEIAFPGVSASGSYIEISAPLPKRIQVAIVVRDLTGAVFSTIQSNVQSVVSSYVNSLGVGQNVVFSQIISLVQALNGVQAVSISSPTYNSTNDQIITLANEKPVVISPVTDITVALAT
jgi:hypothetical protein